MCGNRLNSWKSMPARRRIWRICSGAPRLRRVQRIGLDASPSISTASDRRLLEEVDAAQQGRLAAARAADDHHRLALPDVEVDAAQDVVVAEVLLDAAGLTIGSPRWAGAVLPCRRAPVIGRLAPCAARAAPGRARR